MSSTTVSVPKYRRHKGSGQAFVQVNGQRHYLGKWDSPRSKEPQERQADHAHTATQSRHQEYLRAIRQCPGSQLRSPGTSGDPAKDGRTTLVVKAVRCTTGSHLPVAARTAIERTPLSDILSPRDQRRMEVGDEPQTTPGDSAAKRSETLSGLGIRSGSGRLRQNPPRRMHARPTGGFLICLALAQSRRSRPSHYGEIDKQGDTTATG